MKGLILSGGKGTRLRPLTYTRAKQLVPIANTPILIRVIETIRDAGVSDIGIVVGGDTAAEIQTTIGDGSQWNVKITFIEQASPDGLAHAVKISEDFLGDDSFVMFLGDNAIEGGIRDLIRDFDDNDWNSQIVLKAVDYPQFYGVAKLREDQSIDYLIEKPQDPPSNLALVGIYMFDKHIFKAVNAIKPSSRGELEITDAIQWLVDNDYRVFPHVHDGWWVDTGKAPDLLVANSYVLEELVPHIAETATIDADSEVDGRVTVQAGAKIINSVVRGPTIIGENAIIENSYIGPFTSVYHGVVVQNSEIEHSILLEDSRVEDLDMILRDSLIGRNAVVKSDKNKKPRGLVMNVADHSRIWI
ncbi:MAG: glucose-1-phosphate thymidylyltransferase [Anaerolineae bacterium]|nr:glucose-1-phosphate thymidylyltransferase [Anaerolineae bacterium]MDQ7037012.1 glucose-1-phosphate thymidylyltransferase [Anaerolineae bacterium]